MIATFDKYSDYDSWCLQLKDDVFPMVRTKSQQVIKSAPQDLNMTFDKCTSCDLVINRKGEKRPAIRCKDCKNNLCSQCAGIGEMLCDDERLGTGVLGLRSLSEEKH